MVLILSAWHLRVLAPWMASATAPIENTPVADPKSRRLILFDDDFCRLGKGLKNLLGHPGPIANRLPSWNIVIDGPLPTTRLQSPLLAHDTTHGDSLFGICKRERDAEGDNAVKHFQAAAASSISLSLRRCIDVILVTIGLPRGFTCAFLGR